MKYNINTNIVVGLKSELQNFEHLSLKTLEIEIFSGKVMDK